MKHVTFVEHYPDPAASKPELDEERRIDRLHTNLINILLQIIQMCGFEVQGRIWLKHKRTGKDYP